ncbi:MAG: hypothetical protein ACOZB3_03230 [Calditrichota bacterium]
MRTRHLNIGRVFGSLVMLVLAGMFVIGCSDYTAPTASNATSSEYADMWNPQPGETVDGYNIPFYVEGYWESMYGNTVNPFVAVPPRTFRVGPDGAVIRFATHSLTIPRGAVDEYVMITLSNASVSAVAIDCNPSPFHFNVPVTLTLSYSGTTYSNDTGAEAPLAVIYMAPDGSLEELPSTVDRAAQTVSAPTDHFSRYIIGSYAL